MIRLSNTSLFSLSLLNKSNVSYTMTFAHERLTVYQHAIRFVTWSNKIAASLPAKEPARSQLKRASISIPLNIAEGNAKSSAKDRARYLRVALGSTFECAAILDVMVACGYRSRDEIEEAKTDLEGISKMLVALLRSLGSTLPF